jgi:hypothetical protein
VEGLSVLGIEADLSSFSGVGIRFEPLGVKVGSGVLGELWGMSQFWPVEISQ